MDIRSQSVCDDMRNESLSQMLLRKFVNKFMMALGKHVGQTFGWKFRGGIFLITTKLVLHAPRVHRLVDWLESPGVR